MTERNGPAWPVDTQRLLLGDVDIDLRYRTVHSDGMRHELNPRAFELLLLFLREPRILHSRDAIFERLWPGVIVEDSSLTTCVWMLRRALGAQAKAWIRTVSKQGYVLDPPSGVAISAMPATDEPVAPAADEPAETASPARAFARPRESRRWALPFAVAAALAALIGGVVVRGAGTARPAARVALVATAERGAGPDAAWPTALLHAWLDWQLRSLADITVSSTSAPCEDCNERVVLLNVNLPTQPAGEWRVSARLVGDSAPVDIVERCSSERLVATIDRVSREVLSRFDPSLPASAYPPLALSADAARQLVAGLASAEQHRWGEAIEHYNDLAEKNPTFGFAQVRLAQALSIVGQRSAAERALAHAESWLHSLPAPLQEPIAADAHFIRQDYVDAATAYESLRRARNGDQPYYRMAEAESLRRSGRSGEAAERLGTDVPAGPAAVDWLIQRAEIEMSNRDLAHAATSASDAMDLAQRLGWAHEHARATLVLADARTGRGEPLAAGLLEQAARDFDASGNRLGSLRATVHSEFRGTKDSRAPEHLDNLLSEARLAGNSDIEIDALRRAGLFMDRIGDIAGARERFAQAAAIAEMAGNVYERRKLDVTLLHEDELRLDFDAMDKRLARLHAESLQGDIAYYAGLNTANIAYLRGDYDGAIAALKTAEAALGQASPGRRPQLASTLACTRAGVHMMQGSSSAARDDMRDCRASGMALMNQFADIAEAELAIHTGDGARARQLLDPVRAQLATEANEATRWSLAQEIAPLLARIGELDAARQLLDAVAPAAERAGYRLIAADARITRAEIALAQRNVREAQAEIDASMPLLPADCWYERRRALTVSALIARTQGRGDEAEATLGELHAQAVARKDLLTELQVDSLRTSKESLAQCPEEHRERLVAQSGMRGASNLWMEPGAHATKALAGALP